MTDEQFLEILAHVDAIQQTIEGGILLIKACLGVGFGLLFGWAVGRDTVKR